MIGRTLLVWLLIMALETMHGVLRNRFLTPVVGDLHARQIGALAGSLLVLGTALLLIRWVRPDSFRALLGIGVLWLILTLAFEFGLGRAVGKSWSDLLADYNLAHGGLLSLGMVVLVLAPWLAARIRSVPGLN